MYNHIYIAKCKKSNCFAIIVKKTEKSENRPFEKMGPSMEHIQNL